MDKSKQYTRQEMESWTSCDVNEMYESLTKVGSGTYGEVNKARVRANPSQIVALKKIKDASETEGFPITALREINLLQQCDHPNIVKLLNVATSKPTKTGNKETRGSTFLVFEYMEHELLGYIETCSLSQAQVKCIIKQILEGLEYLHSKDIIHRDIKSANILVNNRGEVKIADFGLAKSISPQFTGKLTQRVVTRWYRSPELLLGCKKYTNKIDMWALGCVFAELLIGRSQALFPAQKTPDQFSLICEKCGTPDDAQWPNWKSLPFYSKMAPKNNYPRILTQYMCRQKPNMDPFALDLLEKMLCYNPDDRITAKEALRHPYFQSYPLPCHPFELPKVDQDCHTFIINNKRKNNYRSTESTKISNNTSQFPSKVLPKAKNPPMPNNRNNQAPVNIAPPAYQFNNYYNCNQVNHIENVNNINVNLFFPPPNQLVTQGNFYNFGLNQQVPCFTTACGFDDLNNNVYIQPNQFEQGVLFNPNTFNVPNNNLVPNFNQYSYFSGLQPLPNFCLNQNNLNQYPPQDPNLYAAPNFRNDQFQLVDRVERSYLSVQDFYGREVQPSSYKRKANNNIDEFEPMEAKKRQLIGIVHPHN